MSTEEKWSPPILYKAPRFAIMVLEPLTSDQAKEFKRILAGWIDTLPHYLVLDFAKIKSLPLAFASEIAELNRLILESERQMVFVNASADTRNFFENAKLLRTLTIFNDIYAFGKFSHLSDELRVNYDVADLFSRATCSVLSDILGPAHVPRAFVSGIRKNSKDFISATIDIEGKRIQSHFTIHLPPATFIAAASKILGEDISEINEENSDVACELVNLIFAQSKGLLNSLDYDIQKALPILGVDPRVADKDELKGRSFVLTPVITPVGNFFTELSF